MCPSWCFPCFLLRRSLQVVFACLYTFPVHIMLTEFVFAVCEVTCGWSQALATLWQCSPQTKMLLLSLLKTEFLSGSCVILCLTIGSIVIGQVGNSVCTSAIAEIMGPRIFHIHVRDTACSVLPQRPRKNNSARLSQWSARCQFVDFQSCEQT